MRDSQPSVNLKTVLLCFVLQVSLRSHRNYCMKRNTSLLSDQMILHVKHLEISNLKHILRKKWCYLNGYLSP